MRNTMNVVWHSLLNKVLAEGAEVSPRGKFTLEVPQNTIEVNMRYPVLVSPSRKLSYKFMAAEAYWILSGDNRVSTIAPYNKNIVQFSDDGETFFGAYGPRIKSQLDYVVNKLMLDSDTRQAGLTIWNENPGQTKDYPCTIAMWFQIRNRMLNCHVFMRSSDIWLGIPYDVFNFSMLAHLICCHINERCGLQAYVSPGTLYITAASQHIYAENIDRARSILAEPDFKISNKTPDILHNDADHLMETLDKLRKESEVGWWL